jgi:hypothetical protein
MEVAEGYELLGNLFRDREWFFDIGMDSLGNYIMYVKFMNHETLHDIPDRVADRHVLVHFAASKTASATQFTNAPSNVLDITHQAEYLGQADEIEELPSHLLEDDLDDLLVELDHLEKKCGSNILQDIFYEVHDKDRAVTNLSDRYPEVRGTMEKLYDKYGFDVIYEELDG